MKLGKILVVFCLAATMLVGCGGKPKDVSQETYDLGVEILDVTDQFLAGDVDISEFKKEVGDAQREMVMNQDFADDYKVSLYAMSIDTTLSEVEGEPSKAQLKEIKEHRSSLKKALGK